MAASGEQESKSSMGRSSSPSSALESRHSLNGPAGAIPPQSLQPLPVITVDCGVGLACALSMMRDGGTLHLVHATSEPVSETVDKGVDKGLALKLTDALPNLGVERRAEVKTHVLQGAARRALKRAVRGEPSPRRR